MSKPAHASMGVSAPSAVRPATLDLRQIIGIITLTGVACASIGIPLAVLPLYLHGQLHCSPLVTGLVLSLHAFSMLAARPLAGRIGDRVGVQRAVVIGLAACAASGLLTTIATSTAAWPMLSVAVLCVARIVLGLGVGLSNTGSLSWAISAAGLPQAARVISYNGIAGYGALAVTPPLGVLMAGVAGLWVLGASVLAIALVALVWALRLPKPPFVSGAPISFLRVLHSIAPLGFAMAMGAAGFAAITTFAALYFTQRGWPYAAWAITAFGVAYIGLRMICGDVVDRFGGARVAMASFTAEAAGLLLMGFASSAGLALLGAALSGAGMSLIYPALGVEVVARVPAANRSSALGAFSLCLDFATGFGGSLFGLVASAADFDAVFVSAGLMSGIGLAVAYRLHKNRGRAVPSLSA